MQVRFWGTRGSIPSPGPGTVRYGGHTSCVSVEHDGSLLVLDAGTGIHPLGHALEDRRDGVSILLSHTHWDHIQGLPFFAPLYQRGRDVEVYGPPPEGVSLADVLRRQMAPPVWPIPVQTLAASLEVTEITASQMSIANFKVGTLSLRHPGGALGFRIAPKAGGPAVAYCTDNELGEWTAAGRDPLVRFLRGCDTLIHDAMYDDREIAIRAGWGHSSVAEAVDLAVAAGVRRLVLFHHDPDRDDADVDRLLDGARARAGAAGSSLEIAAAADGLSLALP